MKGVCVLKCSSNHIHGIVKLMDMCKGLKIVIDVFDLPPGNHGIHIHHYGNIIKEPASLCDHYNPLGKTHGDANAEESHLGDLGNVYVDKYGRGRKDVVIKKLSLRGEYPVLGRSIILHSKEDDLGMGKHRTSKTTGNSGKRLVWGIIGVNDKK